MPGMATWTADRLDEAASREGLAEGRWGTKLSEALITRATRLLFTIWTTRQANQKGEEETFTREHQNFLTCHRRMVRTTVDFAVKDPASSF